jgi:hypothetical protein
MSAKALVEFRDVVRVWIEFRPPKPGELTWSVPADASPEEALAHVVGWRDDLASGEAGFGCRAFREDTPEFEVDDEENQCLRNIVVHVEHARTEPRLSNILPYVKLL